jgi:hypothetical protein
VDPASRRILFFYALRNLDCIRSNNALLTYGRAASGLTANYASHTGQPENGLPSALSTDDTATLFGAAFGNLCEYLHNEDHHDHAGTLDVARCEAFSGGVLKLGLSAIITLFYSTGYGLLDAQLRTSFPVGTEANVSGWTAPSATFDYATVACSAAVLAAPGSAAAAPGIGKPTACALSARVAYADGSTRDMSADARTVYTVVTGASLASVAGGVLTVNAGAPVGPAGLALLLGALGLAPRRRRA